MPIVNPLAAPNMIIQPSTTPPPTTEERQVDLRLEQMVRATVVEGGLDRALLEMNHRQYRAQSDVELQVGQKLTLQVLQTHPTLELRVIHDPLGGRLNQLMPLLTQPYDWAKLLDVLQQRPQQNLPQNTSQVFQQLQQLLQPNGPLPATVETSLAKLPVQLQQLYLALAGGQATPVPSHTAVQGSQAYLYYQSGNSSTVSVEMPQLMRALQGQLTQLQFADGRPIAQGWIVETQQLLAPLQQNLPSLPATPVQLNNLFVLLGQMRQQPSLPPQLSAPLDRLILQLSSQARLESLSFGKGFAPGSPAPAASPPLAGGILTGGQVGQSLGAQPAVDLLTQAAATAGPLPVQQPGGPAPPAAPAGPPPAQLPVEISAGLEKLMTEVQQAQQGQAGKLSPELLGRLEGLLDRLQQLPQSGQSTQLLLPGLEAFASQLTEFVKQGPQRPEGGQLGFLSQLFGFHLEAELLKGKRAEALANLKASLLAMQKEFGEELKEPLQRLEMFQLCKARLAEEQVQFLPLPFNELEEGYLLMEKQAEGAEDKREAPLQLSLSLRLSALGNMRVDMLYDKQGLHLRMACENKEKMEYLQQHSAELEESIDSIPLRGVSFSADAQIPAQQLLERLLPEAFGVLDARI